MRAAIGPTAVAEARARGMPVIRTRHGFRDQRDAGILARPRPFFDEGGPRRGSQGHEVREACGAGPHDHFVEKQRLSAFFAPNLEPVLRAPKAGTVPLCGALTSRRVAATSKDANLRGVRPIVVREATGTSLPRLHEPALEMMAAGRVEVRGPEDTPASPRSLKPTNEPSGGSA